MTPPDDFDAIFEPAENYLSIIDTFDVTFAGDGGFPIKGWLHLPANRPAGTRLPVVVNYAGYSGGRGMVNQDTRWAQAGYAHFIMDTRGQGYGGTLGETADPHPTTGEVAYAGLMTRGAGRREDYYYLRVYVDSGRDCMAAAMSSRSNTFSTVANVDPPQHLQARGLLPAPPAFSPLSSSRH